MTLDTPQWFKQRQAKAEELSTGCYKVSGPNLPEAVVAVRIGDDLRWQAVLRATPGGPDLDATTYTFDNPRDALSAAFELYRNHMIL
jgi:hypothetical protein